MVPMRLMTLRYLEQKSEALAEENFGNEATFLRELHDHLREVDETESDSKTLQELINFIATYDWA
jgi:hypothetical protein